MLVLLEKIANAPDTVKRKVLEKPTSHGADLESLTHLTQITSPQVMGALLRNRHQRHMNELERIRQRAQQTQTPLDIKQIEVLKKLALSKGSKSYKRLAAEWHGASWDNIARVDLSRFGILVRVLEKKGLVEIERRWGNWGYGKPETILITELGRNAIDKFES